jgi:hypothetical protein
MQSNTLKNKEKSVDIPYGSTPTIVTVYPYLQIIIISAKNVQRLILFGLLTLPSGGLHGLKLCIFNAARPDYNSAQHWTLASNLLSVPDGIPTYTYPNPNKTRFIYSLLWQSLGCKVHFQEFRGHLKILCLRRVTWSNFHMETQIY